MNTPPSANVSRLLDGYFLESRARLLEIAANLDRIDRAPDAAAWLQDPRRAFILQALAILQSSAPNRAEQILQLYSLP